MNKRYFKVILVGAAAFLTVASVANAASLSSKLSGRILLQVEDKGKAWYVDPATQERAYLGKPADAFKIMRAFGLGIKTADLEKIATSDQKTATNVAFAKKLVGKILLQVEAHGEAWYVNPVTLKRYFLGRPADAFNVMRSVGLGIKNADLDEIKTASKYVDVEQQTASSTKAVGSQAENALTPSEVNSELSKLQAELNSKRSELKNAQSGVSAAQKSQ